MTLEFGICPVCEERHVLQRSGKMSIHTTAVGERCDGVFAEIKAQRAARERAARIAAQPISRQQAAAQANLDRIEAAAAAKRKKNRENPLHGMKQPRSKMNRSIYAVNGVTVVGGGLPTLGRGR